MKTLSVLVVIALSYLTTYAQDFQCGVRTYTHENEMERRAVLKNIKADSTGLSNREGVINYVPIKPHLLGNDDNTGYADEGALNYMLAKLNYACRDSNIQFYFSGSSFSKYPNSGMNNGLPGNSTSVFHAQNGVNNAVNCYLAHAVDNGSGPVIGAGWSFIAPNNQTENQLWFSGMIIAYHELGHYFGLLHTFQNSGSSNIQDRELVTRNFNEIPPRLSANCANTGDYVCDTDADPFDLPGATTSNCQYTGTIRDANNDLFHPSIDNSMSYYLCNHVGLFTPGQLTRMSNTYAIFNNPGRDFYLNAPETVQSPPTNLSAQNSFNGEYYGGIILNWTDNSSLETGYLIEKSTNPNGPFFVIFGVQKNSTSCNILITELNQPIYFRVKPSNSKSIYSNVSNPVTVSGLCGNNSGQTCDLDLPAGEAADRIENFTLRRGNQNLINNLNSGCSANGIGNYYNSLSANVTSAETLGFTVASLQGAQGGGYYIYVKIFADWNKDNDFDEANELLSEMEAAYQLSGSFTIPSDLPSGSYRLRVVLSSTPSIIDGCTFDNNNSSRARGEMEDYKLNVTSLGVAENQFNMNILFPIPTEAYLNIKTNESIDGKNFKISDSSGRQLMNGVITGGNPVDVSTLSEGIYFIVIDDEMKGKFIKK